MFVCMLDRGDSKIMQLMEEGQKFFFLKSNKNFVTNFHYGQERRKNNNNLPLE